MHHYRCYCVWAWYTRAERIADTISWFPSTFVMPIALLADRVIVVAQDLTAVLQHPSPASPFAPIDNR